MKKIILTAVALSLCLSSLSAAKAKKAKQVKIGIAKIVQHVALDDVERGVMDAVKAAGIDAKYDLQNANGDVEKQREQIEREESKYS